MEAGACRGPGICGGRGDRSTSTGDVCRLRSCRFKSDVRPGKRDLPWISSLGWKRLNVSPESCLSNLNRTWEQEGMLLKDDSRPVISAHRELQQRPPREGIGEGCVPPQCECPVPAKAPWPSRPHAGARARRFPSQQRLPSSLGEAGSSVTIKGRLNTEVGRCLLEFLRERDSDLEEDTAAECPPSSGAPRPSLAPAIYTALRPL